MRTELREAQVVRVLRLRLPREVGGALKILRADQRRDTAHFQLAAVGRDRQRFRVRVRCILQPPGLLLELAEHVRDARLVVDDLFERPDGAVDVARNDKRLRQRETALHR